MKVFGHRGIISQQAFAPYQNTIEAFRLALEHSDGFETDACISKDGVVFLVHEAKYVQVPVEYCLDEHLDDKSAVQVGDRRLDQMMADEIKSLRLKSGAAIPTLQETLSLLGSFEKKQINIELKGNDVLPAVLSSVDVAIEAQVLKPDQCLITSFNHMVMTDLKKQRSDLPLGLVFALSDQQRTPIFPWLNLDNPPCYQPFDAAYLSRPDIQEMQPEYIIIGEPALNEQTVEEIKAALPKAKIGVWVFTEREDSDDAQLMQKIQKYEKDGVLEIVMIDEPRNNKKTL